MISIGALEGVAPINVAGPELDYMNPIVSLIWEQSLGWDVAVMGMTEMVGSPFQMTRLSESQQGPR